MKQKILLITLCILIVGFIPISAPSDDGFYHKLDKILKDKTLQLKVVKKYCGKDVNKSIMLPVAVNEYCNCIDPEEIDSVFVYTLATKEDVKKLEHAIYLEKWDLKSDSAAALVFERLEAYPPEYCGGPIAQHAYFLQNKNVYYIEVRSEEPKLLQVARRIREIMGESAQTFTKPPAPISRERPDTVFYYNKNPYR